MSLSFRLKMPDGSVWDVDPIPIAEDRANYYATKVDGFKEGSEEWQSEVSYAISHPEELEDWAKNNMEWVDLKAERVQPPELPDYASLWLDAEFVFEAD